MFATLLPAALGFWSLFFLFAVFLFISALLIFFILMQRGKGEGLAGMLGGASMTDGMGTPEAQKELSRYTKYLSVLFFIMCLLLTYVSYRCGGGTTGPFLDAGDDEAPAAVANDVDDSAGTPDETIDTGLTIPEIEDESASPEAEVPETEPAPETPAVEPEPAETPQTDPVSPETEVDAAPADVPATEPETVSPETEVDAGVDEVEPVDVGEVTPETEVDADPDEVTPGEESPATPEAEAVTDGDASPEDV